MRRLVFALILSMVFVTVGRAYAYQSETVTDGGTITGIVKYDGPIPKRQRIDISKDRKVCGVKPLYNQALMVGTNGGIENVVVTLTNITKGAPLKPEKGIKFDQKDCEYIPHVAVFSAGSTIDIINSDDILHSIHTESKINPVVDMAQPGFKREMTVKIAKPEIIKVTCDAHNWMEGWWYVTGNPYYAITGADGRFRINDVPAGNYVLQVWQEKLGIEKRPITVKPNAPVTADFTMKPQASSSF
ncbi:MAG: carboxypeptidase regulatory-like domain-containing protein [Candidatus Binataceae bacterium]